MTKSPEELTPQTLIKRVMSGTQTKEYLSAFKKLSSIDLYHPNYSRREIIKLWNSLQSTPNKVRYFTFALVNDNHQIQKRIKEIYSHDKYAYITHDKDTSAEHKHCHYVLMFNSPRSFKAIANDLEIPVTMLEKVYSKKGILDYLTHENDPNKHHYSLDEITANFDIEKEKKDDDGFPFLEFYNDYCKLRSGDISVTELVNKYNTYFTTLNLTTALNASERLYNASCTGAGLSTRSECRVPNPSHSPPFQTAFSGISPNTVEVLDHGSKYSCLASNKNRTKKATKLPQNILDNQRKSQHGY